MLRDGSESITSDLSYENLANIYSTVRGLTILLSWII